MVAEVIELHKNKNVRYPKKQASVRPYRLWDAKNRRLLQWRNYAYSWTAIRGAWDEIQWAKIHTTIEVFNIANGQHIATFKVLPGRNVHRFVKQGFNIRFNKRKAK